MFGLSPIYKRSDKNKKEEQKKKKYVKVKINDRKKKESTFSAKLSSLGLVSSAPSSPFFKLALQDTVVKKTAKQLNQRLVTGQKWEMAINIDTESRLGVQK